MSLFSPPRFPKLPRDLPMDDGRFLNRLPMLGIEFPKFGKADGEPGCCPIPEFNPDCEPNPLDWDPNP